MLGSIGCSLWPFASFFPGSGLRSGGSAQIGLARAVATPGRVAAAARDGVRVSAGGRERREGKRRVRGGAHAGAWGGHAPGRGARCRGAVVRRGQAVPERAGNAGCEGRGLPRGGGCGVPGCRMRRRRAVRCGMPGYGVRDAEVRDVGVPRLVPPLRGAPRPAAPLPRPP